MQSTDRSKSSLQCNRAGFSLNRKWLLGLAAVALICGVAFNWSWLVAAGVAPLLVGILPCVAMCALHLCSRTGGRDVPAEVLQTRDRPASDIIAADLLAVGIGTGPTVLAQDKPAAPSASRDGTMNDDHMMGGSMMNMMGRMNKMMDQCEQMMARKSDPAKRPEPTQPR